MGREGKGNYKMNEVRECSLQVMFTKDYEPKNTENRFTINPRERWYRAWVKLVFLWAIYSTFFTPIEFGFFRGLSKQLSQLEGLQIVVFLVDMLLQFFVAYRDSLSLKMVYDRDSIARHYTEGNFIMDLLGCLPWDAIYKGTGKREFVRYLLWTRLYRMRKINQFFKKTEKDIRVSYLFSRIVKLIAIQLYSVHVAACIFYYLATTVPAEREGHTWIGSLTLGDQSYINFRNLGFSRRYVTSLYYAIVTMATIGYGDIHAVNTMEMIFVIIYVVFNTILGAYVIGNMSAMIVKGSKTERFRDEMANLTQFMHMHNLSKETRNQIKSHLILQYDHGHPRVCLLEDFPVAVKSKVFLSLYFETVQKVPLFKGCSKKFLNQIAINLKEELFLSGEVILEQGTVVDHIYIISQGFLNEVLIGEDGSEVLISELMPNDLFGEVAALCNILQPYTVRACKPCRLLRLQKQALHTILQLHAEENRNLLINLSEGKHTELGKKILVSEMNHHATKRDSELALGLKHAAYRGDLYSLEDLVNAGADINEKDYDGRTSLHIAASRGHEDIVRFLLGQKVEVNCIDHIGNSPLMEAVKAGHEGVVKLLQENGAILELEDPGSYLCKLAADNNVDVLRRLLQYGVDANCQNYDQRTPLHVAAAKGQLIVVLILIEFGADVVAKDRWGNTPIDEGHRCGNKPLIEILNHARENRK